MPSRKRRRTSSARRGGPPLMQSMLRGLWWGMRRGAPLWVLLLLVGGGTLVAQRHLEASPIFVIQRIHEPTVPGWRRPVTLEGQPLWHVHVDAVAAALQRANPQMQFIRVTRHWPADLIIEAVPRQPIAQVRLREFFPLDEEGFIFATGTPAPTPLVPIIEGVEPMGVRVTPGTVTTVPQVHLALRLLALLRAAPGLRGETVALLNVADARQITCRLQRGMEVRIGDAESIDTTLARLGPVLAKLKQEGLTPQYIDLRFADPVIGPR